MSACHTSHGVGFIKQRIKLIDVASSLNTSNLFKLLSQKNNSCTLCVPMFHIRCTSVNFPTFGQKHLFCCKWPHLKLFLPIIEWNSAENHQSASKIQIFDWLVQKLSVLPQTFPITPVNTRACNLYDVTKLLEILLLAINLFVCYRDLLQSPAMRSAILRAYCHGNWWNEPKSHCFGTPWSVWSASSQRNVTVVKLKCK